ncbi:MAG: hypothetical protein PHP00_05295 [Thiotrichaceae bacterium]|nr:hypothetical protein [Thiotrichaceae bacterium]
MNTLCTLALAEFSKMSQLEKLTWLSRLLHSATIDARDTYQVGTNQLENPEKLRRYNEFMHRALGFQLAIACDHNSRMPDEQFFEMLEHVGRELQMVYVYSHVIVPTSGLSEEQLNQLRQAAAEAKKFNCVPKSPEENLKD